MAPDAVDCGVFLLRLRVHAPREVRRRRVGIGRHRLATASAAPVYSQMKVADSNLGGRFRMRNRIFAVLMALSLFMLFSVPTTASADWLFTPFVGVVKGGTASTTSTPWTYGVSFGGMGAGVIGLEADFGYSPSFFGPSGSDFGDNNVLTFMGNLIIGAPIGGQKGAGVRPYVVAGVGLVKQKVNNPDQLVTGLNSSDFGFDIGGGVIGFFSNTVGVRGDFRYFRNFSALSLADIGNLNISTGTLNFWRITGGLTLRF
jgi:Outer membrane protein beta-barrel domain